MIVTKDTTECTRCGIVKEHTLDFFIPNKRARSGLSKVCRECSKETRRRYREKNKDKIREYDREYYRRNRERVLDYHKEYYIDNKEIILEKVNAYRKENLSLYAMNSSKRRSMIAQLPATLTLGEWQDTVQYFNHTCAYCGEDAKLELEHFIPVTRGGGYTKENIIPACRGCNASKHNRYAEDWYRVTDMGSLHRLARLITHFNSVAIDQYIKDNDIVLEG